ncbi:hypothetical protein [Paracoccus benzoatiresistens]|uniref:Concanavalin A-like lectin/glucanase superfamily protein n=1 Tax=Paracoccus benzoatiresistens TaxID=2997341 RepID=A0ABT4J9Z3_9RHOB|nr:hypothetical protein [Paracoccus sp. EF6]MCZ0963899.1 hypothetical protein [Paracoccus sp. EF6]
MKHIIKRGSTRPTLRYPLPEGVDLTGAEATFIMTAYPGAAAVVNAPASIASVPPVLEYAWQHGDTEAARLYVAEFELRHPDGAIETYPQVDYIHVEILPNLGNGATTPGPISATGAVVETDMDFAVGLLSLGILAVTLTGSAVEAVADTAAGSLSVQSDATVAPLRTATSADAMTIHSGHSLTDTFFQGGAYPGVLHGMRESASGTMPTERTAKSTIPGSSTRIRWEATDLTTDARLDIASYELLTITERGLDATGVAPPYTLDDPIMAGQMAEDMEYLWRFVDNARRNGSGGAGAESLLWAIWPAIDGSMGDFRTMLDTYEPRWHYRQELVNTWLAASGETQHPYMHVIPGHRLMARIYDDIEAGTAPGLTAMQDLFSDNIHPNHLGVYAIGCLVYAVVWQESPAGFSYQTDPATPDALRAYFQGIAWEIATTYARAGLGGSDMGAPGLLTAPTDVAPAAVPGLLYATTRPVVMDGVTINTVDLPTDGATGADLYFVIALDPAVTQPKSAGNVFQILTYGGETALALTYRSDMDVVIMDNGLSGGNHASHGYPEDLVTAQTPAVVEGWLDSTTGRLRGIGMPSTTTLMPSDNAATSIRFGTPDWGGEVMAGTIHAIAVYDRIPTDDERVNLRAWAHEQAGLPFTERATPALPTP